MSKKNKKSKRLHGQAKHRKQAGGPYQFSQQRLFQQAVALHQAGRLPEAEGLYRQILTAQPHHPEALHFLGMLAHQAGKSDMAAELIGRALTVKPDYIDAAYNLGIILYACGKLDEAAARFRQALAIRPKYAEAHNNLGVILNDQNKLEEAETCFRRALDLKPQYPEAHNNLANALLAQGKLDEAAASYRQALSLQPSYAEAQNNLGIVLQTQGRLDEAAASFQRALTLHPGYVDACYHLGVVLQKLDRLEEAISCYRQTLSWQPNYVEALNNLGVIFRDLGKIDEAIDYFRKALAIRPDYVGVYKNLALLIKGNEAPDVVRDMEDLYRTSGEMTETDRLELGFALGKCYEDIGDYDKAFAFISQANQLKRKAFDYAIQNDRDLFERIKKIFSPDFFAAHHGSGFLDSTPIFILGMPRSGTTLVEQILASHPLVFGADELTILEELATGIERRGAMGPFPEGMLDLDREAVGAMGKDYVDQIRELSRDAKFITDKMPHNFLRIGLIHLILPKAKVIHCVRNPMDTCLSIFKKDFTGAHGYAYDLLELGQYYTLYQDLMEYWETVLPGYMYTLSYEEMIAGQHEQTKRLLAFCALPWNDDCLTFHKTERMVRSASHAQVRQPIYKSSVELWKRYENQLEPLRKVLEGES